MNLFQLHKIAMDEFEHEEVNIQDTKPVHRKTSNSKPLTAKHLWRSRFMVFRLCLENTQASFSHVTDSFPTDFGPK